MDDLLKLLTRQPGDFFRNLPVKLSRLKFSDKFLCEGEDLIHANVEGTAASYSSSNGIISLTGYNNDFVAPCGTEPEFFARTRAPWASADFLSALCRFTSWGEKPVSPSIQTVSVQIRSFQTEGLVCRRTRLRKITPNVSPPRNERNSPVMRDNRRGERKTLTRRAYYRPHATMKFDPGSARYPRPHCRP